jgi:hypothetical protein
MSAPVYLVACVGQKAPQRCRAADLYQSDWFKKARAYVESEGERWFILSAEHGLLSPTTRIAPYETNLATIGARRRALWGERVAAQLDKALGRRFAGPLIFIAGRHYRDPLLDYAGERARVPMQGLGIGQQKHWLAERVREARERADRAAQLDLFDYLPPIAG